ncbi:hypothetical protein CTM55_03395 [Prevotella intermedia]|nr:hypothetical protein CTM55_03395 [Prevotella intermedia]
MNSILLAKAFSSFILANTALCLNLLLVREKPTLCYKGRKETEKKKPLQQCFVAVASVMCFATPASKQG